MKLSLFFRVLLMSILWISSMKVVMAIEEPQYQVLLKESNFELRAYQPMLIAEVSVQGTMSQASGVGFRLIADYILGNNEDPSKRQSQKIAMTAPVTIEADLSEKISMTAPVTIQSESTEANSWKLFFVMPKQYSLENIPKPKNHQIQLVQIPAQQLAVITFSGLVSQEKFDLKTAELLKWAAAKSYKVVGQPQLSRYNPPWTLPFLRRNEVWVKLDISDVGSVK